MAGWSVVIFTFPSFLLASLNASNIHQNERYQLNCPREPTEILTLTISLPLLLPGSIFFGKKVVVSGLLNKRFGGWSGLIPLRLLRLPEQDCGAKNQPGTNLNPSLSAWSHQKIGNSQRRKVPWSAQHHQCCLLVYGTKKRTSNDLGPLTPNSK